jgi:hypothetical protein
MPRVSEAWDAVVRSRAQYLENRYDRADAELRLAIALAAESLCFYYGFRPVETPTFEFSERICTAFFKHHIAEGIFERAQILGGMMPLPNEPLHPDVSRQVRRSIAASSELCAFVESFVYFS